MMSVKNHQMPPMMRVDRALGISSDPGRREETDVFWQRPDQGCSGPLGGGPTNNLTIVETFCLGQWFSKCGLCTSSIRITWALVRNAHSWAPPRTN